MVRITAYETRSHLFTLGVAEFRIARLLSGLEGVQDFRKFPIDFVYRV
jgi:hypothetical protein